MTRKSTPARLGFISHKFQQNDGQGRVNYEVVRAALDAGYHVTILATTCADDIASHANCQFVQIGNHSLPTELVRNFVFSVGTTRWLRKHRQELDLVLTNGFITWEPCDIVVAHFVHAAWVNSAWYPFKALKPYALYQYLYTLLNVRWERESFLAASIAVAVSPIVAEELVDIGVPRDKIEIILNGIETEQFHPGESSRAAFGLPAQGLMALFAGDLKTPRKNLDTVLKVLVRLPEWSLAVAGDLKRSPYPEMAKALGISDRVFFLGQVKRMNDLMRSTDLFVFPSRYEPFGLVVLEAMASGTPVIVSACSGAAPSVGDAGFVLEDPNDVDVLVERMNTLAQDAGMRAAMGAAGRRRALELQWSVCAQGYLRIFERFLISKSPVETEAGSVTR